MTERQFRRTALLALFASLVLPSLTAIESFAQPVATATTLEDFDGAALGNRWTAVGKIRVERVDVPADARHEGVGGKMVRVDAAAGSVLAVRPDFERPEYEKSSEVLFRARCAEATEQDPFEFEFRVYSDRRRAWFWRKITLDGPDWRTIQVPLRFCRHSSGAFLSWPETRRFAFFFRREGKLTLDGIEILPSSADHPATLSAEDIGAIAFRETPRYFRNEHFVVITDEPQLNGARLLEELEELREMYFRDFPNLPRPEQPAHCLVFAREEDFRRFWPRLAERFHSAMSPVTSDGFTTLGIAGSYYSDAHGSVRPVYLHETCHVLIAQTMGIGNSNEWLHEGLANYYQLNWTKQDVHELMRSTLRNKTHARLKELLDGKPIEMKDYAQTVLVIKWLMADPERKQRFTSAIKEMRDRCSTDLAPIAKKHFGMEIEQLEAAWYDWAIESAAKP